MTDKAYYIVLEDRVVLSRKDYTCWQEIQDEYYETYKTNFQPLSCAELLQYLTEDFKEEQHWPFSRTDILNFFESEDLILYGKRRH